MSKTKELSKSDRKYLKSPKCGESYFSQIRQCGKTRTLTANVLGFDPLSNPEDN